MNLLGLVFGIWLVGLASGAMTVPLVRRITRIGKQFFVVVNPKTKAIDTKWVRVKGDVADVKFSAETPFSVALDGPLRYSHKGSGAFLVDSVAGVAFDVQTAREKTPDYKVEVQDGQRKTTGKAGEVKVQYLDGARLYLIRKCTRVLQIQSSNSLNLKAMLVAIIVVVGIVGLVSLAGLVLLTQLAG